MSQTADSRPVPTGPDPKFDTTIIITDVGDIFPRGTTAKRHIPAWVYAGYPFDVHAKVVFFRINKHFCRTEFELWRVERNAKAGGLIAPMSRGQDRWSAARLYTREVWHSPSEVGEFRFRYDSLEPGFYSFSAKCWETAVHEAVTAEYAPKGKDKLAIELEKATAITTLGFEAKA